MGYSLVENTEAESQAYEQVKTVAIIGAGVAGLQLAERLLAAGGKSVTIFEKSAKVGGVWSANYADFGLQVPKELYEFPSFPYPNDRSWDRFPKGPEVQEYIEAFASHFSLDELIRFNTSVVAMRPNGNGWSVTYADSGTTATEAFDFVVVATGMYGYPPNMPSVPGKECFKGDVMHSFNFTDREQAAGKRVVVVGGGKSAVDCAVAAVKGGADEVTLLFREAHWPTPRYLLNVIPFKFATYNRLGHALLPTHHDVGAFAWWLHALLTPLKWLVWRLVELIIRVQFQLPREMVPTSRIEVDLFTGGQILTYEARDMINAGTLKIKKGAIARFEPDDVALQQGGTAIACDLVVYGTGFIKSYDYLDASARSKLQLEKDGLYLYRSMLPVGLPGLAFVGCEVSTFNNILTHGLQAAWLTKLLCGEMRLPPARQMQRALETEMNWKRTWMPPTSARAAIQQLHMPKYHDALVADMGHSIYRKSNPLFEALLPYNARDYSALFGRPDRTAWMRLKAALLILTFAVVPLMLSPSAAWTAVVGACVGVYLLPEKPPARQPTADKARTRSASSPKRKRPSASMLRLRTPAAAA